MMIGGMIDYGWFFWREALAVNAVHEGLRSGSLQSPDIEVEGAGQCAACLSQARRGTVAALEELGFHGASVQIDLDRMPATGTPCTYALMARVDLPHHRVMPLVPGASEISVEVASMAQAVTCP